MSSNYQLTLTFKRILCLNSWIFFFLLFRYKTELIESSILEEKDVSKQWGAIAKIKNAVGEIKYPLLSILMKSILSVPHSNADSERIFSMVKKNHTEFRASMNVKTLSSLVINKVKLISNGKSCFDQQFSNSVITKAKKATSQSLMSC